MRFNQFLNEQKKLSKPISAGVAILRNNKGKIELLLTRPTGLNKMIFGFPKGGVESEERILETAYREGEEETGLKFVILNNHKLIQDNPTKKIIIFLAKIKETKNNLSKIDENGEVASIYHDWENDIVKFFPINNLPPIFKNQQEIADQLLKLNLDEFL